MDDLLKITVSLGYQQPSRVVKDVKEVCSFFEKPCYKIGVYTNFENQARPGSKLIMIDLPAPHIDESAPIQILLPLDFPSGKPIVQIKTTTTMLVNPTDVDENDNIRHCYLDEWIESSSLLDLIQCLMIDFKERSPVFDFKHFKMLEPAINEVKSTLQHFPSFILSWRKQASSREALILTGSINTTAASVVSVEVMLKHDFPAEAPEVYVIRDGRRRSIQQYVSESEYQTLIHKWCYPENRLVDLLQVIAGVVQTREQRPQTERQQSQSSPSTEEVRNFIQRSDLPETVENELVKNGFTTLRAIRCLEEGDLDKLKLGLADICLLRQSLKELRRDRGCSTSSNTEEQTSGETAGDCSKSVLTDTSKMFCKGLRRHLEPIMVTEQQLKFGKKLGSGHYGVVYKGELLRASTSAPEPVVVKTILMSADVTEKAVDDFIAEILIMPNLKHENILELRAIAVIGEIPHLVLPYMHNGDLLSYLKSPERTFSVTDLLKFSLDVARGMKYLSESNIIHCDLTARNCLVDANCVVKISDFGLARRLHFSRNTRVAHNKIPIRWMAPEVLTKGQYTLQSDVWSYGILCWEIFTKGEKPYAEAKNSEHLTHLITAGFRLTFPRYTPVSVQEIISECWEREADGRPSFANIVSCLRGELPPDEYLAPTYAAMPNNTLTERTEPPPPPPPRPCVIPSQWRKLKDK